ncbi:ribbon-helix-helix domain-containing protein [Saccharomonospora iraqiensis]|uniref:ribbon-helix-helix domain-containing protein n=1 Tax=Saccharomonospora iraqiensis TaxID=52698 RepID=UPI00069791FD|nr:CopG family transcriptional regulator [Saccharomonospora iraqiensis]
MVKTTVYIPDDLEVRLDAEAAATGTSKAELIRRGITMVLETSERPRKKRPLPVFNSGSTMTSDEMDEEIRSHIEQRAARR